MQLVKVKYALAYMVLPAVSRGYQSRKSLSTLQVQWRPELHDHQELICRAVNYCR